MKHELTTAPVGRGDCSSPKQEFGRTKDVERTRGIKRGTLYNLFAANKIRGYLVRAKGQKSGVRLWDLSSIDRFIRSQCGNNAGEKE
jgi:hypothetical protein